MRLTPESVKRRADLVDKVRAKWLLNKANMGEWDKRRFAATEAIAIGRSGRAIVSEATGLSRSTVTRGIMDLEEGENRINQRKAGGGRLKAELKQEGLLEALKDIVLKADEEAERTRQRSNTSLRKISDELNRRGFKITPTTVGRILSEQKDARAWGWIR
ncbi:MAG: hypothetical protein LBT59_02090 [Clostridiales bacterium]|jgi:hypothetical protein|nr:hypothetical protein [Clostridiales bacterium]